MESRLVRTASLYSHPSCRPDRSGGIARLVGAQEKNSGIIERASLCKDFLMHPEDGVRPLRFGRGDRN